MPASSRTKVRETPSDQQTAEYTYDMLTALKELATARGQETLAVLLSAAADEARALAKPAHTNGEGDNI